MNVPSAGFVPPETNTKLIRLRDRLWTLVTIFVLWVIGNASIVPKIVNMFSGDTATWVERGLGAGLSLVSIAVFLTFLMWLYRASSALEGQAKFSPKIALGAWFVPVVNLVLPPVVLRDLYKTASGVQGAIIHVVWWVVTGVAIASQVFLSVFVALETSQPALIDSLDLWSWLPRAQSFWNTLMPVSYILLYIIVDDITQEITKTYSKSGHERIGSGVFDLASARRLDRVGSLLNISLLVIPVWMIASWFLLDFILYELFPAVIGSVIGGAVDATMGILYWIAYTFFFVWLYRLFEGTKGEAFFPPWLAVLVWFIPVVNLIVPLFVLRNATRTLDGGGGIYSFMIWPLFLLYAMYFSLSFVPPNAWISLGSSMGINPMGFIFELMGWGFWLTVVFFGAVWFYFAGTHNTAIELPDYNQ